MLVKDGQEIKPDDEEEPEDQEQPEPEVKLSNKEIIEALSFYAEAKGLEPDDKLDDDDVAEALSIYAEMKQGRTQQTQQVKAAPTAQPAQPKPQKKQDNGYGEYKFVNQDEEDEPVGWPAFIASVRQYKSAILAVVSALVITVILFAAINSWKNGSKGVVEPTSATPVQVQQDQPVQPVQPASNCTIINTTVVTKTDKTENGMPQCLLTYADGQTFTAYSACQGFSLNVGDPASYCK